jgi:hypothetical protein
MEEAPQVTATPVMVAGGVVRAIVKLPDLLVSCVLVAVTVTEVPVAGALTRPVVLTVPAEIDQVVALEKLPVPVTAAEQFVIVDCSIEDAAQLTDTAVMLGFAANEIV